MEPQLLTKPELVNPYLGSFSLGDQPRPPLPFWRGQVGTFRRLYTAPCPCGKPTCGGFRPTSIAFWASDGRTIYGPYVDQLKADRKLTEALEDHRRKRKTITRAIVLFLAMFVVTLAWVIAFSK